MQWLFNNSDKDIFTNIFISDCESTVTGYATMHTLGTWCCCASWSRAPCWPVRTPSTPTQRETKWDAFYFQRFVQLFIFRFSIILITSLQQFLQLNVYSKLLRMGLYSTRAASVGAASTCWTCSWSPSASSPSSSGRSSWQEPRYRQRIWQKNMKF